MVVAESILHDLREPRDGLRYDASVGPGATKDVFNALAAAGRESLSAPTQYLPVLAPTEFHRRIAAVVLDGTVIFFAGGMLSTVITFAGWGAVFGTSDFDGPPHYEALGNWLILATWCALASAYTAIEAFGVGTLGKAAMGLRLVVPSGNRGRRLATRWLLAYLPFLVLALVCAAGASLTATRDLERFEDGWEPDLRLLSFGLAIAVPWAVGFLWCIGAQAQTLAERLTGVELLYTPPPTATHHTRAFEVAPLHPTVADAGPMRIM
jgi:hypothetical protein